MKLQKHFAKKIGDKVYNKYVVVIPPEIIKESGFKEGDELVASAKSGSITLKKK
ncbi:AbrB/MazE/SpoVT family DNA-binding domain-containing protein [Candidatus Woesearchaeota archaeon]|nr:AbrB/MazE/SpoVT family DNA-binding domain-containing protein [Candidatus Woesearchaeota archaeon]